jgi:hypothetical protein
LSQKNSGKSIEPMRLTPCQRPLRLEFSIAIGLEPTTHRLIPTRRDSTLEQLLPDPAG